MISWFVLPYVISTEKSHPSPFLFPFHILVRKRNGGKGMAFLISGGKPLYGNIRAQGAKNAALPMLFATLLCRTPVTLYGVPDIGDVRVALSLLSSLGAKIERDTSGAITVDTSEAAVPTYALKEAERIRASSYLLGASVTRFGEGSMPYPGGCSFGVRPLDYHRAGFEALHISWEENEKGISVRRERNCGASFHLPYPSVGATVNFILAALGAEGESTLFGYAQEHHVLDFIAFLRAMGASIQTEGAVLHILGGRSLSGGSYTVTPDAIEAGTYLIAAAATGGTVTVEGVRYGEISPLLLAFGRMNIPFRFSGDAVTVFGSSKMRPTSVIAAPYPAFPTDLHPQMTVLLSRAAGGGRISDLVWNERFSYLDELEKMGLKASRFSHGVRVFESRLHAAAVRSPDLRGGAALVTAALVAEGESRIEGEDMILRGYEMLACKLFSLGAELRVSS